MIDWSQDLTHSPIPKLNRRRLVAVSMLSATIPSTSYNSGFANENKMNQQSTNVATIPQKVRFCLNTSTINGGAIPVREQLKIASDAGYDSVELWLRDIDKYVSDGGSISELRNEMADLGLGLDSAIAFGTWIVDDADQRKTGLEQCRRDMDRISQLGGTRIAAPPVGATNPPKLDLELAAARYRELLEIGKQSGVVPQLEVWGFSHNLSTLAEALYVATAAQHADACLLLDVYHLYKGGYDFCNLMLVPTANMRCLHLNDYPKTPDRTSISDKDRVYPGDGIAPIPEILRSFWQSGFQGSLSLELFNREYWEKPAAEVAKVGLEKMKHVVEIALSKS